MTIVDVIFVVCWILSVALAYVIGFNDGLHHKLTQHIDVSKLETKTRRKFFN